MFANVSDAPHIEADKGRNAIIVHGTEQQIEQVRKLVKGRN
jgi:type II secretory pathway component GspD/PulD (secretin)